MEREGSVEAREARLKALRQTVEASIAEGGERSEAEVRAVLAAKARELASRGF